MNPTPQQHEINKTKVDLFNEETLLIDLKKEYDKAMEDFQSEQHYVESLRLLSILSGKNIDKLKCHNKIRNLKQKLQELEKSKTLE